MCSIGPSLNTGMKVVCRTHHYPGEWQPYSPAAPVLFFACLSAAPKLSLLPAPLLFFLLPPCLPAPLRLPTPPLATDNLGNAFPPDPFQRVYARGHGQLRASLPLAVLASQLRGGG